MSYTGDVEILLLLAHIKIEIWHGHQGYVVFQVQWKPQWKHSQGLYNNFCVKCHWFIKYWKTVYCLRFLRSALCMYIYLYIYKFSYIALDKSFILISFQCIFGHYGLKDRLLWAFSRFNKHTSRYSFFKPVQPPLCNIWGNTWNLLKFFQH